MKDSVDETLDLIIDRILNEEDKSENSDNEEVKENPDVKGNLDIRENVVIDAPELDHNLSGDSHKNVDENLDINQNYVCVPNTNKSEPTHPLYTFGVCRWQKCEFPCKDLSTFME